MPHTQRKKKSSRPKRREEVDEDGWTRITKSTQPGNRSVMTRASSNDVDISEEPYVDGREISPSAIEQAPDETSLEVLRQKYEDLEKKWLASLSCKVLHTALENAFASGNLHIKTCILFGSASFSALARGWISRHNVSLTQLAVFKSAIATIERLQGTKPAAYAQEPRYNNLDSEFLFDLQIETVQHPAGFELIKKDTFAYTPGSELFVCLRTLFRSPGLYLSHKLDMFWRDEDGIAQTTMRYNLPMPLVSRSRPPGDTDMDEPSYADQYRTQENERDCLIQEKFLETHHGVAVPDLEAENRPFWGMHLYWPKGSEDET